MSASAEATPVRILLVEDDEDDALLLVSHLRREGFAPDVERVWTAGAMRDAVARSGFDVVLSDFTMPEFDALRALGVLKASGKDIPFIVVSGTIGEDVAVRAMKAGARDYFSKSNLGRLASAISREMREARVRQERQEALASKRAAEEQLRLVVDSVRDYAIYALDPQGRIASWPPGAARVYGWSGAEILGHPFARLFAEDDVARGEPARILDQVAAGASHEGEFLQVCRDGSMFWADATVAPLREDAVRPQGFSVVVRDVTDRVKLLEELRVALRSRDEFLSMASHELRTPVTTLRLQLQTFRRALERSGEGVPRLIVDRIGNLERQTGRIAALVGELLDISRMRLGRFTVHQDQLDLAEVVRETVERLREQATRAGCPLLVRAPEAIPGSWDRLRVEQVLGNLLVNATKFGAGKPIEVAVEADGERARITVVDHGIGIDPKDQARVFDRFERAVSAQHYGGLGLGLFIARQIVEAHGGTIAVRSVPGEGSAFTVELPRAPAAGAEAPPRAADGEPAGAP